MSMRNQKIGKTFGRMQKKHYLCIALEESNHGDPLAQLVEHHTFNVGVLGSNPKRITEIPAESQRTNEVIEDFTTSKVLSLYIYG